VLAEWVLGKRTIAPLRELVGCLPPAVRYFYLREPSASLNFPRSGIIYREFHSILN
jgi:hypothetical protein